MAAENKVDKLITLERVLGSEISFQPLQIGIYNHPQQLSIASPDLHSELVRFFGTPERTFFTTNMDVNRLVKYGDGSFSSMVKGVKGIAGHQGFDAYDSFELANDLFMHIGTAFNNAVAKIYASYVHQINLEINNVYQQFQLKDFSKIKSISFFLKEVYSDIYGAGFSKEQAQATLTNVQRSRIDLRELVYRYMENIRSNIHPWQQPIPINELASNYLSCRYCISLYTIALVSETILSNRLDDNGFKSLKTKVSNTLDEFNELTNEVHLNLGARYSNNQQQINNQMLWIFDHLTAHQKNNENNTLNNFASNHLSQFCKDTELSKIDEILKSRDKLLSNIVITEE
ncbi:Uncharacterised protein [Buttiauxella agrestis]|uniref:Uncharacterized protein n=1 Tax=Buttiauxella agrestis TaxID=82977 RepID=A0A381KQ63_9ENTR|nr:hypothetical protein [Buttiauxella agrestis]SUY92761.1 Uncharacterised protein [Buttiauxella agrestis]